MFIQSGRRPYPREHLDRDESRQFEQRETKAHMTLEERVRRFERQEIQNTLLLYGQDMEGKRKAAKELGISLATLYNKMKE